MRIIRKIVVGAIVIIFTISSLAGCGGRQANPVATYHPTDEILTCKSLLVAMDDAQNNIERLIPETDKTGKNIAIGAAGVLLFLPALFFLDFSDAEKVEIEAYRSRYNHLVLLYQNNDCALNSEHPQVVEMPKFDNGYKNSVRKKA